MYQVPHLRVPLMILTTHYEGKTLKTLILTAERLTDEEFLEQLHRVYEVGGKVELAAKDRTGLIVHMGGGLKKAQ